MVHSATFQLAKNHIYCLVFLNKIYFMMVLMKNKTSTKENGHKRTNVWNFASLLRQVTFYFSLQCL